MIAQDSRPPWLRLADWVYRHRASRVFEYTLWVERTQLTLWRRVDELEVRVAELHGRVDELERRLDEVRWTPPRVIGGSQWDSVSGSRASSGRSG